MEGGNGGKVGREGGCVSLTSGKTEWQILGEKGWVRRGVCGRYLTVSSMRDRTVCPRPSTSHFHATRYLHITYNPHREEKQDDVTP